MKLNKIHKLAFFMTAIISGMIQAETTQQKLIKAVIAPKKVPKAKIITLSTESLDEIKIYNDTAYPVTLVTYDPYNSDSRDTFTIEVGETFSKNTRLHDGDIGQEQLAKLLLYDLDKTNRILLLYRPRTDFSDDSWNSITVLTSKLLK